MLHERFATDLPLNSRTAITVVDNPLAHVDDEQKKISVLRSLRDDPLADMYARSHLDDAEFAAGRMYQTHLEHAEIGSVSAIDPTKEAVDGGRIPEPITDRQIKAIRAIAQADKEVGEFGVSLLRDVLVRRMSITQICAARSITSGRQISYMMQRFREDLDAIAKLWGFST